MRDYGQACPVAMATEIFAERWTPLIIRELLRGKSRFGELRRGLPRMSTALLSQRLRSLERDGVVRRLPDESGPGGEYRLTAAGEALGPVIEHLGMWGQLYVELRPTHADPGLLMQWIHEHLNIGELPRRRVVVHFTFPAIRKNYWLILEAIRPREDLLHLRRTGPGDYPPSGRAERAAGRRGDPGHRPRSLLLPVGGTGVTGQPQSWIVPRGSADGPGPAQW